MPALADIGPPEPAASRGGRWADLGKRTASAAVLAPVALACVWFGGWGWGLIVLIGAVGLAYEWSMLCRTDSHRGGLAQAAIMLSVAGAAVFALLSWVGMIVVALLAGCLACWLISRSRALVAGLLYVGLPLACLAWLRELNGLSGNGGEVVGRDDVVFLIAVVWASDIGAYLAGRLLGGAKLAPSISPGKTRSGAVGGLMASMLVGECVAQALMPGPFGHAAAIACVLGVASQAGDLLESWIKRQFGVKDSGWLIPGHGGLLDRLDGLLAAAPAAACIAVTAGQGGVLWH